MSDVVIDPKENPELAAQQLVIELIKAEKTAMINGAASRSTVESIIFAHQSFTN
ncbi:TPA: hypothetical protein SMM91_003348 [Proteus mirabilis]|nr:hypothetical protein [Proteus mirabilis]HBC9174016.1 hypothetical protein [Proteus mirabilis]HEJ9447167.1 hypothetical protein [Proteus mirabilis]HEJ9493622.1 hypothetical protein [Proteus mirabilis]HEK0973607.1 hypothetical protein [Proteus mirabilis]